ncbi:MAG: ABC transporter permease, partial [Rhodoluna sp.]
MKQSKRTPIILLAIALFGLWLWLSAPDKVTNIKVATDTDLLSLPDVSVSVSLISAICFGGMLLAAAASGHFVIRLNRKTPLWINLASGLAFVVSILIWLYAGATMPISALFAGALALAVPLVFGSLAGILSERAGIVNISIESQLLAGAFISAVAATLSHNLYAGLIGAIIAGALVSWVLATFAIKYLVDQIIVGVVLNVLIVGLTNFLFSTLISENIALFNQPPRFDRILIPLLGQIPVIGPVLFNQTLIVYLMYLAVAGVWIALFKTRWGL